jgi:GTP-binding protein EngB required for normal cell division
MDTNENLNGHPPNDQSVNATGLNDSQRRYLRISCQHIDKLLEEVEGILHSAGSKSPFPRYKADISPAQIRVIEDYVQRLRGQLLRALNWQHIETPPAEIPVSRAVRVHAEFMEIALDDLRPGSMRGRGSLTEQTEGELRGVVEELRSVLGEMQLYLLEELNEGLGSRANRLHDDGTGLKLALQTLEDVITRHGLVEFRPRLDALIHRMEDDTFDVALFGRVSSGKSSLLNALLGSEVLPVGVTPITAVPTRLRYGAEVKAWVAFGAGTTEQVSLEDFARYVSEQGNPSNNSNVVRALLEIPAERLREGVVMVDTPGLGSLARKGAQETMAYLPSCDLAVLLLDASSTLNLEDIGTLRLLLEAAIPAVVVLSKADLLNAEELRRTEDYIHEQLRQELHVNLTLHPVSSVVERVALLDQFFERELLPRFTKAKALRAESVKRKLDGLRNAVAHTLQMKLNRTKRASESDYPDAEKFEAQLRGLSATVAELGPSLEEIVRQKTSSGEQIMAELSNVAAAGDSRQRTLPGVEISEMLHDVVHRSLQQISDRAHETFQIVIQQLRSVGSSMGREDIPGMEEAEEFLRDMPRFEMAELTRDFESHGSSLLGLRSQKAQLEKFLQRELAPVLQPLLRQYGEALRYWIRQMTRKFAAVVNSYIGAYRLQVHEQMGLGTTAKLGKDTIEDDLAKLQRYRTEADAMTPAEAA